MKKLLACLMLLTGCMGTRYNHMQDPRFDFEDVETFACAECLEEVVTKMPRYDNEENRNLVRNAIIDNMTNLGYTYSEDDPDILVEFVISIESKVDTVVQRTTDYRYWNGLETVPYNYKKGTIFVNVIHSEKNTVVWQGSAQQVLDEDPRNVEKKISKFVAGIFEEFPFKSKPIGYFCLPN